jgi:hypothetical protein
VDFSESPGVVREFQGFLDNGNSSYEPKRFRRCLNIVVGYDRCLNAHLVQAVDLSVAHCFCKHEILFQNFLSNNFDFL